MDIPSTNGRQALLPTLDRRWYTDPDIFSAERERIWGRRWILAARASELAEPGSFVTAAVAGESVIVVRDNAGAAGAFLNVCRHRGSRILLEERGVCRGAIRCPYHSWSYGFDGALRGAPNLRDWVGEQQTELGLQRVEAEERYGCIWVNLDAGGVSFEDDIVAQVASRLGAADDVDAWELDRLVTGHRVEYDVHANWKLLVENFMECYHCSSIHPELVAVIPEFRGGLGTQSHGPGYGAAFGSDVDGFTVDGRAGLAPLPLVGEDDRRRYYGITLTPSCFLNLVGDHAILHRIEPRAVDRTRLVCDWLFAPEVVETNTDVTPSVELFDRVNRQDFDACERCQLGATSSVYRHGNVLVPVEHHLGGFYAEVREAVAA